MSVPPFLTSKGKHNSFVIPPHSPIISDIPVRNLKNEFEQFSEFQNKTPLPFEAKTPNLIHLRKDINNLSNEVPPFGNLEDDLDLLKSLNSKYTNNPSIGYLNINSLRGDKFIELNNMLKMAKVDILCIDETKLSSEIPTSRLHIEGYQYPPLRRDRPQKTPNSFAGGNIVYVREGFISKRIVEYETKTSETICLELSLRNKNGPLCSDID